MTDAETFPVESCKKDENLGVNFEDPLNEAKMEIPDMTDVALFKEKLGTIYQGKTPMLSGQLKEILAVNIEKPKEGQPKEILADNIEKPKEGQPKEILGANIEKPKEGQFVKNQLGNSQNPQYVKDKIVSDGEKLVHFNPAIDPKKEAKFSDKIFKSVDEFTKTSSTKMPTSENVVLANVTVNQIENVVPTSLEGKKSDAVTLTQQIKDQVIDRILISTNDINADKEVKITLSPRILENTEVSFKKNGQALSIQFVSTKSDSLYFLQNNQTNLQTYLRTELKQFNDVAITIKKAEENTGQPGDGRSRNRYDYQSMDEDEQ